MSEIIEVESGETTYAIEIHIGNENHTFSASVSSTRMLIVTNETIAPLYLGKWYRYFVSEGFDVAYCIVPDGEQYKNFETLNTIYHHLIKNYFSRNSIITALGGGVIGDMAGFAAATYQRGVGLIQIPTTLLACVDSSVGGKTAINHALGKNMIGAFYQPDGVFIESQMLKTLPEREYSAGIAEIIKYGCIADAEFYDWLNHHINDLRNKNDHALAYAIKRSCQIKADIVARDETETIGDRALLNFGHTFGHAIEAVQHYQGLKHGEAVAVGMVIAANISYAIGYISQKTVDNIGTLIQKAGLPVTIPDGIKVGDLWEAMKRDKKNDQGHIRFILLQRIGQAFLAHQVDSTIVNYFLKQCMPR
jgi:3-dehydroquinate synthase